MNFTGLIIGVGTFIMIGVFHVIVIKAEYFFSKAVWPVFAVVGIAALIVSACVSSVFLSAMAAVFGFTCLWSIKELFDQEKRVQKGWFAKNPKRKEQ